jgi:hypothetical protein
VSGRIDLIVGPEVLLVLWLFAHAGVTARSEAARVSRARRVRRLIDSCIGASAPVLERGMDV